MSHGSRGPKRLGRERALIERAAQQPGLADDLPEWLVWCRVASRWHVPPMAVADAPLYWVSRELTLLAAEGWLAEQQRTAPAP